MTRALMVTMATYAPPPLDESTFQVVIFVKFTLKEVDHGKERGYSAEEIITKLREAEVLLAQGGTIAQVCKKIGVTDQTYYRWRKEYGGMKADQAKRLKELEHENVRLKKLVADQALDLAILKDVARGNF